MAVQSLHEWRAGSATNLEVNMNARAKKLAIVYRIDADDAQALVAAGLDTPRKARAGISKSKLPKSIRDKVKARK